MKNYTETEVEAALCIWEAIADNEICKASRKLFDEEKNAIGTIEMRRKVMAFSVNLNAAFKSFSAEKIYSRWDSYDWDFIPCITSLAIIKNGKADFSNSKEQLIQIIAGEMTYGVGIEFNAVDRFRPDSYRGLQLCGCRDDGDEVKAGYSRSDGVDFITLYGTTEDGHQEAIHAFHPATSDSELTSVIEKIMSKHKNLNFFGFDDRFGIS